MILAIPYEASISAKSSTEESQFTPQMAAINVMLTPQTDPRPPVERQVTPFDIG